jgi:hypothetical protein
MRCGEKQGSGVSTSQPLFAKEEWDPTFIANVKRDGIILYACGSLTRHCFARRVGRAKAGPYTLRR